MAVSEGVRYVSSPRSTAAKGAAIRMPAQSGCL